MMSTPAPDSAAYIQEFAAHHDAVAQTAPTRPVRGAQTYFEKMQNFEKSHPEDVFLPPADLALLVGTFKRIDRVQSLVGHGNFNVLSFDEMLKFSKRYSRVGAFEQDEVRFIESMFHESARRYGFFGNKVTDRITAVVTERERYKVPYTGHFLYRGAPLDLYRKLERDLEKRVVLTSGIRSVVKQTHLSSPGPSRQRVIFRGRPGRSRLPDIPTTASATLAWARSASVGRTSPRRSPGPRSTTASWTSAMSTCATPRGICSAFVMNPGTFR